MKWSLEMAGGNSLTQFCGW